MVQLGVTLEQSKQDNIRTGIGYDGRATQVSGDIELTPGQTLAAAGVDSEFKADNTVVVRQPQNFELGTSVYSQTGRRTKAAMMLVIKPLTLDARAGEVREPGDNPFDVDRDRVRAVLDMAATAGVVAEYVQGQLRRGQPGARQLRRRALGLYLRWTL